MIRCMHPLETWLHLWLHVLVTWRSLFSAPVEAFMEPYLRTVRGHSGFSVPPAFRNRDIGTLLTGETVSRSHQEIISIDV